MPTKYQVPLRDGSGGMLDVTVKGLRVYDTDGKDLGPVRMFPGLKRVDGNTGSFFDGAKGGKYDTETAETPAPGGEADAEGTRVSQTGVKQSGKKLGLSDINGLFASLNGSGKITAGELPSANSFFSEALPTTEAGETQGHEGPRVNYSWDSEPEQGTWDDEKGAIIEPSVPDTTGGKPDNAEDGTSAKPDIAEAVRNIRMSPDRLAARSAFLDPNNKGYNAIRARDRAVGAYDQFGTGGMNINGQNVQFKEGMSRDARFELSGGGIQSKEDAQAFLKKYTNALSTPDTEKE